MEKKSNGILVILAICITLSKTALSIGTVTITSPNGGQNWESGSIHNIIWTYSGQISAVDLQYTTDGGNNWTFIASPAVTLLSYSWTLPQCVNSTICKVKIIGYYGPDYTFDLSNSNFTISYPMSFS